jgi:hypothetical protein
MIFQVTIILGKYPSLDWVSHEKYKGGVGKGGKRGFC